MEKIIQGDSISRDVTSETITDFTGWTGTIAVVAVLGEPPILAVPMQISEDKTRLEGRIPPTNGLEVFPVGKPFIEIEVNNASLNFRRTLPQEQIQIIPQSIV